MTRAALFLLLSIPLSAATLKVRIGTRTIDMPVEKYVAAVLAGESSVFQSDEALNAMSPAESEGSRASVGLYEVAFRKERH